MVKPVTKAVFPVAGLGTRFLPATKAMPKEMLPIVDKPLIQYAVEEAYEAGIEHMIFVTGRGKNLLEDHFDIAYELEAVLASRGRDQDVAKLRDGFPKPGQLSYTRQQEPLGLGHAVWCAREFLGDDAFAVILPDDLIRAAPGCLSQMMDAYQETGGNVVAVENVPLENTNQYGILDVINDDGHLAEARGLVEKPAPEEAPSTLSIIGRYILQPEVFDHLNKLETGAGNEIQLTDAIAKTIGNVPFHGLRFKGQRFDCGSKVGFVAANVTYAMEREDMSARLNTVLKNLV